MKTVGQNYPFRFKYLFDGLKAAYPNITYISTAYNENADYTVDIPAGTMWDTHHYEEPNFFIESFDFWDNWQEATNNTDVTIFVGEYSVFQINTPSGVDDSQTPLTFISSIPASILLSRKGCIYWVLNVIQMSSN
jgi:alpha-N-arabinofuranosidase